MGTGAPSNSIRRKSSSEDRKRKKKASRTAKSSKRRRRHDSPSLSSRSDDHSSPSTFSSDLEGGGGRDSRGRNGEKGVLDRRRRSPSRDGRRKKKKKKGSYRGERESKKRRDSRSKLGKGNHQKKGHDRRRRCCSISSSSSRSTSVGSLDEYSKRSCSTCRSRSSSPGRTKSDKSLISKGNVLKASSSARGRSSSRRDKERSGRRPSRVGYRYRSPTHSSCSRCSHEDRSGSRVTASGGERHHDERRLAVAEKSHSRHPLSDCTLVKHTNKMEARYGSFKDEHRAGIVQGFDDLHTSGNNESYDVGRERDSGMAPLSPSQHAPERKRHDDSSGGTGRNGHGDKPEAGLKKEINSSVVVTVPDDGARWGNRNDSPMPRDTQTRLKSEVSRCGGNFEADKLEVLLRQKALENFKKFRARATNANSVGENKYESIPIKANEVTTGKAKAAQFHGSARPNTVPAKQKSYTSLEHHTPANDRGQLLHLKSISDANVPAQACGLVEKTERNNRKPVQQHAGDTVNIKTVPDSLFSNSDPCSKEFQAESSGKILEEALSCKNVSDNKNSAKAGDTDIHKKDCNRVDVSGSTDTSCRKSASEFEQKTMSVMHGGEVVQVSYKVYIPKKTPALARRRLQR